MDLQKEEKVIKNSVSKRFSLTQVMFGVSLLAIIGGIAVVAIPCLIESHLQANETNAAAALKTYGGAQAIYKKANYGGITSCSVTAKAYNPNFANLGGEAAHVNGAGTALTLIPDVFANATSTSGYQGYFFTNSKRVTNWVYECALYADPCIYGKTGVNSYWIDQEGVVRMKDLAGVGSGGKSVIDSTWVVP